MLWLGRSTRYSVLAAALAMLGACGSVVEDQQVDEPDAAAAAVPMSLEEFVDNYVNVFAGDDGVERLSYDEDVVLDSQAEIEEHYEAYRAVVEQREGATGVIASRVVGPSEVWTEAERANLTYCVSNDFFYARPLTVAAMDEAARAWEAVANVRFIHLEDEAENCTASNANVVFSIVLEQWGASAPYATAFRPTDERAKRSIAVNWDAVEVRGSGETASLWSGPQKSTPLAGALRHQLGHVLGLGHRVGPVDAGNCLLRLFADANSGAQDETSAMLTAPCADWGSVANKDLLISVSDGERAAALYP